MFDNVQQFCWPFYLFKGEFEKYKCKLENIYNKFFIRQQKAFAKENSKEQTKTALKVMDIKGNEIEKCMEKVKITK